MRLLNVWRDRDAVRAVARTLVPVARAGFVVIALSVVGGETAVWEFGLFAFVLANVGLPPRHRPARVVSLAGWTGCLFAGRMLAYV
ncbi:hypothetical protein ACFSUD_17590 [Sulfitobacter aestuarii]|uniref:Uncharacterized protein n=1 Tax=Sulfitobacter aestuarii TaxID=2161676 RepID=A0ABW5U681_9RHOB